MANPLTTGAISVLPALELQVCQLPEWSGGAEECFPMGAVIDSGSDINLLSESLRSKFENPAKGIGLAVVRIKALEDHSSVGGFNMMASFSEKVDGMKVNYLMPRRETEGEEVSSPHKEGTNDDGEGEGEKAASSHPPLQFDLMSWSIDAHHYVHEWKMRPKLLIGMKNYDFLALQYGGKPNMLHSIFGNDPQTSIYAGSFELRPALPSEHHDIVHVRLEGQTDRYARIELTDEYIQVTAPGNKFLPMPAGTVVPLHQQPIDMSELIKLAKGTILSWILKDEATPRILSEIVSLILCKPKHLLLSAEELHNPYKYCRRVLALVDTGNLYTTLLDSVAKKELNIQTGDGEKSDLHHFDQTYEVRVTEGVEVQLLGVGPGLDEEEVVIKLRTQHSKYIANNKLMGITGVPIHDQAAFYNKFFNKEVLEPMKQKEEKSSHGTSAATSTSPAPSKPSQPPSPSPHASPGNGGGGDEAAGTVKVEDEGLHVEVVEPSLIIGADLWEKVMRHPVVKAPTRWGVISYYAALGAWSLRGEPKTSFPKEWAAGFRAKVRAFEEKEAAATAAASKATATQHDGHHQGKGEE